MQVCGADGLMARTLGAEQQCVSVYQLEGEKGEG